jgi:L-aspartate oxidase
LLDYQQAELATRDIVARAIDSEMKTNGFDCVYLDISFKGKDWIQAHFPTIDQKCASFGIDIFTFSFDGLALDASQSLKVG